MVSVPLPTLSSSFSMTFTLYMQSITARSSACLKAPVEIEIWPLVFSLIHTLSWGQQVLRCKTNEEFFILKEGTRLEEEEPWFVKYEDLIWLGGVSK